MGKAAIFRICVLSVFFTACAAQPVKFSALQPNELAAQKSSLQAAIRRDPKQPENFLKLGDLSREEGDRATDIKLKRHSYRYALASYEMAAKLSPGKAEPLMRTAELYFAIRDLKAAAKNYQLALALEPNFPGAQLRLAQISRNDGDPAEAERLLQAEVKANPDQQDAWVELGNLHMSRVSQDFKELAPASKAFAEALRMNPLNSPALFGLGFVRHLEGRFPEALELFAKVTQLEPKHYDVFWQIGLIHERQHDNAQAIAAFRAYRRILSEEGGSGNAMALRRADDKIRSLSSLAPPTESH
jgi:tetratricopeptide (TPR) repeat protein